MSRDDTLPSGLGRPPDPMCERFEAAWLAGGRPRLEDFVSLAGEADRAALLAELLPLELHHRARHGERPAAEEYRQRLPGYGAVIDAAFAGVTPSHPNMPDTGPADPLTGIDSAAPPSASAGAAPRYRPVRYHARGGLGEVWVARDAELNRDVALKLIRPEKRDDAESRRRFLMEAEVTARLGHPGVVPVYGLVQGEDGQPCYAMRFIDGETLSEAVRRFHEADAGPGRDGGERSLALRGLLDRFVAACNTIAYAHSRGVLHRDIKPGNIMLGKYGETLVVDWGLAKVIGRDEQARAGDEETLTPGGAGQGDPTRLGAAMGTPAYMSPEQAAGRWDAIGPASDIYSLGATLYVMLTGEAPFKSGQAGEVLAQVQRGDYVPPRRLKPNVPPALEAVCLKAMALRPEDRYRTASDLASDVQRWLADQPVAAWREPLSQRVARWSRRHRAWVRAGVLALAGVALVCVAALVVVEDFRSKEADQRQRAEQEQRRAVEQQHKAEQLSAQLALDRGLALCEAGEVGHGLLWLARALQLAPPEDDDLRRVIRINLADWRTQFSPLRLRLPHDSPVSRGAFSPDGRLFATGTGSGVVRLWNTATGQPIGPPLRHGGGTAPVAFSPDGQTLLTANADHTARLWRIPTGEPIGETIKHDGVILCAGFSPDGKRVLTGSYDKTARQWDSATGRPTCEPMRHQDVVLDAAISADGTRVLTAAGGVARLWDAETGLLVGKPFNHNAPGIRAAFSPDGKAILTYGGRHAQLWDTSTCEPIGQPLCHGMDHKPISIILKDGAGKFIIPDGRLALFIGGAVFGPDGQTLLTAVDGDAVGEPWAIRWSIMRHGITGISLGMLHPAGCPGVFACSDGRRIVLGRKMHVLGRSTFNARGAVMSPSGHPVGRVVSPDDRSLLTTQPVSGFGLGEAYLWDIAPGKVRTTVPLPEFPPIAATISSTGRFCFLLSVTGPVVLVDLASGQRRTLGEPRIDDTWALGNALAISADDRFVILGNQPTSLLWDTRTGERRTDLPEASVVAFSRDSNAVLTGSYEVSLRETATGAEIGSAGKGGRDRMFSAGALGTDSRRALLAWGAAARLWDLTTGEPTGKALEHQGEIELIAYSPDGRTILTGSKDKTARLWDAATLRARGSPLVHDGPVLRGAFSRDGKTIITARDEAARVWDVATSRPLGTPIFHGSYYIAVGFSADQTAALTVSGDGISRWPLSAPVEGDSERIRLWVEAITRLELDDEGVIRNLEADARGERLRRLRDLGGPPVPEQLVE
jgi:WD40 repeat protein/tRNA A-37 threonylcarbamoyl transferase component Bud32